MRIFDLFKKTTKSSDAKSSDDLFDAARRQTNTDSLFGGAYMSPEEFQALAERIRVLDPRVDWLTMLGGSASGHLSGSGLGQQLCNLRPLENRSLEGLVFTTTLIPMPPSNDINIVIEMMQEINGLMSLVTGSNVGSESGMIRFVTITLRKPSGFTDPKLVTLVNMNLVIGDEILRALITVHQRQISPTGAIQKFSVAFQEFMDHLSPEVLNDYYARVAPPPEHGQIVSYRIVR